jgi:predicted metalloprotease
VRWDRNYTSSDVDDRRGEVFSGGGGGGVPIFGLLRIFSLFGWKGILVGLVIAGAVMFGGRFTHPQQHAVGHEQDDLVHEVSFVFDDVQKMWAAKLPDYRKARLELFRDGIRSACGTATVSVGPFYCPGDERVYIDLSFYQELADRLGAGGDFAQAYVIAHEVGHHVQKIKGLFGKQDSISTELQADCLAGAWAKDADRRGIVETGDIDEALNAAIQIGDDTLQKKATGHVQPEKWTHGSSQQRHDSFAKGYKIGPEACGI